MMPALPVTDFVVGQTRFALGTLDAFFDAMLGLGRAGELRFLGLHIGVGHVVIGLDDTLGVTFSETDDDQDFCVTFLPLVRAPDHTTLDDLDDERTFRTVAHIDGGPVPLAQRFHPLIDAGPRPLRMTSVTGVLRRFDFQIANLRI